MHTLLLSTSVLDVMRDGEGVQMGLWEHSLATARAAAALAEVVGVPNPEELGVAGLLHDVGKLALQERCPEECAEVRRQVASRRCLPAAAERAVLGATHADVGGWLLAKWQLPEKLRLPVAQHHAVDPGAPHAMRAAIVHVADVLVRGAATAGHDEGFVPPLDPRAWHLLGLTTKHIEDVLRILDATHDEEHL